MNSYFELRTRESMLPEPATCLKIAGYPIEIVATDDNRIRSVRICLRQDESEDAG